MDFGLIQSQTRAQLVPMNGLSTQVWTRIFDNPPLIHGAGDRKQCDKHESNALKTKEPAGWADIVFYDKSWCPPETAHGQNKLAGGDHCSLAMRGGGGNDERPTCCSVSGKYPT